MRRVLGTTVSGAVLFGLALGAVGCGGAERPPPPPRRELTPAWADVFEGTPDLYAVVRVQALKRDPVYGSFWTALLRAAEARGFARGATMIDAVEGADEIVVGSSKGLDAAIVLRGVPASLDPATVRDEAGQPLFRVVSDRGRVLEYEVVDRRSADGGLFVLPDRTWVGALGEARPRAREAFSNPTNRAVPPVDGDALASIRFGGTLAHVLDRSPTFGRLARKLVDATFGLRRNKGGLVIALRYADGEACTSAETVVKAILANLGKEEGRFAWLRDGVVTREGPTVLVRLALPPRLLEELPQATGRDLGL